MPRPTESPVFHLYQLLEAVAGIDGENFTEEMQAFLRDWQPPEGRAWSAYDEERRQMFAAMKPGEFFATWRSLRTALKRAVFDVRERHSNNVITTSE